MLNVNGSKKHWLDPISQHFDRNTVRDIAKRNGPIVFDNFRVVDFRNKDNMGVVPRDKNVISPVEVMKKGNKILAQQGFRNVYKTP